LTKQALCRQTLLARRRDTEPEREEHRSQRRVESTPQNEGQYQELSRDYDSTKQLYATLLKRFEDAQLAETMESKLQGEQFRIIDPAMVARPVSRLKIVLAGLVLSIGLAVVSVLLISELLLLVVWEIVSERPRTYEVWGNEHAIPELPR